MSVSLRGRAVRSVVMALLALAQVIGIRAVTAPTPVLAASQAYTFHNAVTGGGGGYIVGIDFNPAQQNLIYARTDIGGAYRWSQSTGSWAQLLAGTSADNWNLSGVESIGIDPVQPNRLYLAVGTYTNGFTNQNGAILRSTDYGNTFQTTMLPFKNGSNMPARGMGERLAVDPNDNAIVYFGSRLNGLWKSTDFGATWNQVPGFTAQATYVQTPGDVYAGQTDGISTEVFDPRTGSSGSPTQTIYASIVDKGNSIYRSTDGGATWSALAGQPTGFLPHHLVLVPSTGMMYVTYSNGAGPYDGTSGDVWKYNTATAVWTKISPVPSTDTANDYFGYGGLSVDAQHPNTIMVAALNSWWPDEQFFRSLDGGTTWTRIWDWTSYPSRSFRYAQDISAAPWLNFGVTSPVPPVPSPKIGWMVDSLQIDPFNSNRFMYGTGATLYGANDLLNWDSGGTVHISVMAAGIEEMSVLDLISPPSGASLLSGVGDDGGFVHTSLTTSPSTMFTSPTFTTTTSLDYAELNPAFVVRVENPTTNGEKPIGFTFNDGGSWFQGNNTPSGVTSGGTVAAAADASRVVWAPGGGAVSFSTDNGNSWTAATGIPNGAVVASDRVSASTFYGAASGAFYTSTNGGASFTASSATGLPTNGMVVKAVAGHQNDVWVSGANAQPGNPAAGATGLWHSTNGGTSFTKLSSITEVDCFGFGAAAPGQAYPAIFASGVVGGVHAIYRSDNGGSSWVQISDAQHQYATIQTITGDPRMYGRVYFGTNGMGIVYGDPAGSVSADFSLSANPSSLTLSRGQSGTSTITVNPSGGFAGSVSLSASGLPSGVTASFSPTSTTGTSTLTLSASSSATTGSATLTVTGTSGSLSHTTTIALTVNPVATPDFSLSASPAAMTVGIGASGTSTITVTPTGGFTGSVSLAASGLPSGVTASFSPTSTTGTSTLTLSASSSATSGSSAVTVTGTSGSLSHTTTITLTVAPTGGGVTITPVVAASGGYYNEEDIQLANTASLTAMTITIVVQRTTGVSFSGMYNTVGSQITQANSSTASAITYTFTLASGQTLGTGSGWKFAAQASGTGTVHPVTGDTWTVTYTTGGTNFSQSGTF